MVVILRNKTEVGLKFQTTGYLNARLCERRTPWVPTPHPNHTASLTAPVDGTTVRIYSTPNVAPNRRRPGTKSRWIKHSQTISKKLFILFTLSRPVNDSLTEHNYSSTIESHPGNSGKSDVGPQLCGHPIWGNHQIPRQRNDPAHA